jgi:hypothetical protein
VAPTEGSHGAQPRWGRVRVAGGTEADRPTEATAAPSTPPSDRHMLHDSDADPLIMVTDSSRIDYLVLLIAFIYKCKLDMEQHCDWMGHGAAGLRGKGRLHAHAP